MEDMHERKLNNMRGENVTWTMADEDDWQALLHGNYDQSAPSPPMHYIPDLAPAVPAIAIVVQESPISVDDDDDSESDSANQCSQGYPRAWSPARRQRWIDLEKRLIAENIARFAKKPPKPRAP